MYRKILRNDKGEEIGCRVDRAENYSVFQCHSGYIWELPANSWTRRDHGVGMPAKYAYVLAKAHLRWLLKKKRDSKLPLGGKLLEPR